MTHNEPRLYFEQNRDSAGDYVEGLIDVVISEGESTRGLPPHGRFEVSDDHREAILDLINDSFIAEHKGLVGEQLSTFERDAQFGSEPLFIETNPTKILVLATEEANGTGRPQKALNLKFFYPDGVDDTGAQIELTIDEDYPTIIMKNMYRRSYRDSGNYRISGGTISVSYAELQEFIDICAHIVSLEIS